MTKKNQTLPEPNTEQFKQRVKELLEIREGVRADKEDAFVTYGELQNMDLGGFQPGGTKPDGQPPKAPQNVLVAMGEFENELTWDKSVSPDVWYYEIWRANVDDRNEAEQIAVVTHPNIKYIDNLNENQQAKDQYYWMRALDWSGLYSTWVKAMAGDGQRPEPPTDFTFKKYFLKNVLTWTVSTSPDARQYELRCSTYQDERDAQIIAVISHPHNEYQHVLTAADVTENHYYRIRTIDWSGLPSGWTPPKYQGPLLVPGDETYAQEIDDVLDILHEQITESELNDSLNSRIDLIDGPEDMAGSVDSRIQDAKSYLDDRVDTIKGDLADAEIRLDDRVDTVKGNLSETQDHLNTVEDNLSDAEDRMATIKKDLLKDIDLNKNDIANIQNISIGDGTSLITSMEYMQGEIGDNSGSITDIKNLNIDENSTLITRLESIEGNVDNNSGSITNIKNLDIDNSSALITRLESIEGSVGNNTGEIEDIKNLNIDEDSALLMDITTLQANVDDNSGEINDIKELDINENSTLITRFESIEGNVDNNTGEIENIKQLDIRSDAVLATTIDTMQGRVDENSGLIKDIKDLNISSYTALITRFESIEGNVGDNSGEIEDIKNLDISDSNALITRLESIEGNVGDNSGTINDIKDLNISSYTALITRFESIEGNVDNNSGEIQDIKNLEISSASILAERLQSLQISDDTTDNAAGVSEYVSAKLTESGSAIAEAAKQVGVTVDGKTYAVEQAMESIYKKDGGIKSEYTVKIDNAGAVSGFGLIAGEEKSQFQVNVDRFAVTNTQDGNTVVPFAVGQVDGQWTVGIDGEMVVDGSILANSIGSDEIKARHLTANEVYVATIESTSYSPGYSGWKINASTQEAEFNDIIITINGGSGVKNLNDAGKLAGKDDVDYDYDVNGGPPSDADNTAKNQQNYDWIAGVKPPKNADNTQDELDLGADISNAIANEETLIAGGYLNTDILKIDDKAVIKTGIIKTAYIENFATTNHVSIWNDTHKSIDAGDGWVTIKEVTIDIYSGNMVLILGNFMFNVDTDAWTKVGMRIWTKPEYRSIQTLHQTSNGNTDQFTMAVSELGGDSGLKNYELQARVYDGKSMDVFDRYLSISEYKK